MKIYADSDALPRPLKDALLRAAQRTRTETFFVAARSPRLPESEFVRPVGAGSAFNGADDWIVEEVCAGDLVITADIPLADRALAKGAEVLNTKGEFFTAGNIKNAMAMRELLDELRVSGEIAGNAAPFSERTRLRFIDALNRFLQKPR
ncbi:MAG: DUF188 domain-containing protein [Victivallaceae bacterium]|nr:DUF188 domain-containing protein [Victivallaceae bacterium]